MAENERGEKNGCGCGCCRGRLIRYITPLLLGGLIGYLAGSRCAHKAMCPVSSPEVTAPAAQTGAPATTPPK
jgi:hypothetical protein